ncbi:hypothetical protein PJ912_06955 [Pectobacterium colocasium]
MTSPQSQHATWQNGNLTLRARRSESSPEAAQQDEFIATIARLHSLVR